MKNIFRNNRFKVFSFLILALLLMNCEEDETNTFEIVGIVGTGTDINTLATVTLSLNELDATTNVPLDVAIVIEMSDEVDANSVTNSSIQFAYNGEAIATNLTVSGSTILLEPLVGLDQGFIYIINFNASLSSTDGTSFTSQERFFRTGKIAYDPFPMEDNLVAWWRFDKQASPSIGNFGVATEQISYDTDRFGNSNGAASFGGAAAAGEDDILAYNQDAAFLSSTITIATWFKVDPNTYTDSWVFGVAGNHGYAMKLHAAGTFDFWTSYKSDDENNHTSWFTVIGALNNTGWPTHAFIQDYEGDMSALTTDGEWHQIVMTYDENFHQSIYIDANLIVKRDLNTAIPYEDLEVYTGPFVDGPVDAGLAIGYAASPLNAGTGWLTYAGATDTFNGLLDDFRIWNVALSAEDIQLVYNNEKL